MSESPIKVVTMVTSPIKIITTAAATTASKELKTPPREAVNLNPEAKDCYFYFYSICSKGDGCKFRHCSAALGSEETCDLWKNSVCRRKVCVFRHSQLDRQRSIIPCYWESQATGCLKPHCPFLHTKPRPKSLGVQERLTKYKMASIKIKSLEELQREKMEEEKNSEEERKKKTVDEERIVRVVEMKDESNRSNSSGSTEGLVDLRKELMRRMLAEQKTLRERLAAGTAEVQGPLPPSLFGSKANNQRGESLSLSSVEHSRSGESEERNQRHEGAGRNIHTRPTSLSYRTNSNSISSNDHKHVEARLKGAKSSMQVQLKENADDSNNNSKRSTPKPTRIKTSKKVYATQPKEALNFKVKTLEELKAERSSQKHDLSPVKDDVKKEEEEDKGSVAGAPKAKKISLIRQKPPNLKPVSGGKDAQVDISAAVKRLSAVTEVWSKSKRRKVEVLSRRKSTPSLESEGIGIGMGDQLISIMKRPSKIEREQSQEDHRTMMASPKEREVTSSSSSSILREKKVTSSSETRKTADSSAHHRGDGRSSTISHERKKSINELKQEILQELEKKFPSELEDDDALLEEMALYDEESEGVIEAGQGGMIGLSDSRNHDELILQMEEFM